MVIREEVLNELLGSREVKTQDDLFGKDGMGPSKNKFSFF